MAWNECTWEGSRFRVKVEVYRVQVKAQKFKVHGSRLRVSGPKSRVQSSWLEFRVEVSVFPAWPERTSRLDRPSSLARCRVCSFNLALYVKQRNLRPGAAVAQCSTAVVFPLPATASHATWTRASTDATTAACSWLAGGSGLTADDGGSEPAVACSAASAGEVGLVETLTLRRRSTATRVRPGFKV